MIVCSHAFLKKSRKTPQSEIDRTVENKRRYFDAKRQKLLDFGLEN